VYEQQNAIYDDCELGKYFIDEQKFKELRSFEVGPGDIIISCSGTIGRIALLPAWAKKGVINQALLKLTLNNQVILPHYFRFLFHQKVDELIAGNVRGSAMVNITGVKDLKKILWPVPPLDEQRKIVAEIEKQFTRLEAGVAGLRRVQANLKRYRAAVLKAACEGKLVPTEAELARQEGRTYETGAQLLERILTERREKWSGKGKYKDPVKPDVTDLPLLPHGWSWASVGQLGEIKGGKRLPMGHGYSPTPTRFPYLRVVDFENYGVRQDELKFLREETQKEIQRYTISKSDVYISIAGSIGIVGIIPDNLDGANLTENAAKITSLLFVERRYICFWLSSTAGCSFVADKTIATTQPKLALFRIEAIPIPLPPLGEQQRIVAEVERRMSVVAELEAAVNANLQRATRLRQSILQRAFEGKLVSLH
jgi:type I restriction enzyme S subunit